MSKSLVAGLRALSGRRRGFRLSLQDVIVIAICIATTALFHDYGQLVWLFPITLGHFFLFCNVFRVCRRLEFMWAIMFVANVTIFATSGWFGWATILAVQTPVTVTVIAIEIRSSRYHGVFSSGTAEL